MDHLSDSDLSQELSELRAEIERRRGGLDPSTPNGRDYPDGNGPLYRLHMAEWQRVTASLEVRYQALGAERARRRDAWRRRLSVTPL